MSQSRTYKPRIRRAKRLGLQNEKFFPIFNGYRKKVLARLLIEIVQLSLADILQNLFKLKQKILTSLPGNYMN